MVCTGNRSRVLELTPLKCTQYTLLCAIHILLQEKTTVSPRYNGILTLPRHAYDKDASLCHFPNGRLCYTSALHAEGIFVNRLCATHINNTYMMYESNLDVLHVSALDWSECYKCYKSKSTTLVTS